MKGKDKAILPIAIYQFANCFYSSHTRVTIRQRIFQFAADGIVRIPQLWEVAAMDEQLCPRADGRADCFHQNFVRAGRRQRFLVEFHPPWRGEVDSLAFHAPILPGLLFIGPPKVELQVEVFQTFAAFGKTLIF